MPTGSLLKLYTTMLSHLQDQFHIANVDVTRSDLRLHSMEVFKFVLSLHSFTAIERKEANPDETLMKMKLDRHFIPVNETPTV